MKLYIYQGLDDEEVPRDVTHVIVDNSVTVIKKEAFSHCTHLVSVIVGDNVKRIEEGAFYGCIALRFIRLSKTLEYIGKGAFYRCESLEALFLPSTVTSIEYKAFCRCHSLRLLILPNDIDLTNIHQIARTAGVAYERYGHMIIHLTNIHQIARTAGVAYERYGLLNNGYMVTDESNRRVNEWLFRHMDEEAPFHKLCYNSSITTKQLNDYLNEHGNDSALAIDPVHGMTPLHMLSMNPHAPAETIAALLDDNVEVAFRLDNQGKMSLDYTRDYNVDGLVGMVNGLCNHRHAA